MGKRYDDEYVEFVSHAMRELRRTAYLLCGDWHRAEDATQDALIRLYRRWPKVERRGGLLPYARRTLLRTLVDQSNAEYTRTHLGKSTALPYCVTLEPYEPSDALAMAPYEEEAVYTGSGDIYRPDGRLVTDITELRFELPDGTTVTQQVKDAKWAVDD